jgi:hypothetical protein
MSNAHLAQRTLPWRWTPRHLWFMYGEKRRVRYHLRCSQGLRKGNNTFTIWEVSWRRTNPCCGADRVICADVIESSFVIVIRSSHQARRLHVSININDVSLVGLKTSRKHWFMHPNCID